MILGALSDTETKGTLTLSFCSILLLIRVRLDSNLALFSKSFVPVLRSAHSLILHTTQVHYPEADVSLVCIPSECTCIQLGCVLIVA